MHQHRESRIPCVAAAGQRGAWDAMRTAGIIPPRPAPPRPPSQSAASRPASVRAQGKKFRSFRTRTISTFAMIGGFALFIYGGHVPLALLVLTLQVRHAGLPPPPFTTP